MFKKSILGFIVALLVVGVGWANVDPKISFQGRLTEDDVPITSSTDIYVNIYDGDADDAAASVIWTSPVTSVTPDDGFFTMILEGNNLSDVSFDADENYSVEIVINGVEILSPRQTLTAAPYAVALTAGSKTIEGGGAYALNVINNEFQGTGIYGWGTVGIVGESGWIPGYGVKGLASGSSSKGIYGSCDTGTAIYGVSSSGYAGKFFGDVQVSGLVTAESDDSHAFSGLVSGTDNAAVRGESTQNTYGYGIYGKAPRPEDWLSSTFPYYGPQSYAGYFDGDVMIDGDLCVTGIITCDAVGRLIDRVDIELGISNKFNELDTEITELAVDIDELQAMDLPIKYFDWKNMLQGPDFPDPRVIAEETEFFYLTHSFIEDGVTFTPGIYYYDVLAEDWVAFGKVDVSYIENIGELASLDQVNWGTDITNIPSVLSAPDELITVTDLDGYVTQASLDSQEFISATELSSTLGNYVTQVNLDATLADADYATTSYVSANYLTSTALDDYVTQVSLDGQEFISATELSGTLGNYVLQTDLDATLTSYVTDAQLNTALSNFTVGWNDVSDKPTNFLFTDSTLLSENLSGALPTDVLSASDIATRTYVSGSYLTSTDLSGYAAESWVTGQDFVTDTELTTALDGYATTSWVTGNNYVTDSELTTTLSGYATESWVTGKGFATQGYVTNQLNQRSSRKYKNNITLLSDDFFGILKLEPKSFTYKDSGKEDIGLIAEEVDVVGLSNLVIYKDGQPDAVKYDKVALYVLEVVKAQQEEIQTLKEQNSDLAERIQALEGNK